MIIDKIEIIPKKVKLLSVIISILGIALFVILTVVSIVISKDDNISILTIVLGLLSSFSAIDFLRSIKSHRAFAIFLAQKIYLHYSKNNILLNNKQEEFISQITNNIGADFFYIIAHGDKGTGKTTAALNLVENIFSYSDRPVFNSKKEIIYISCLTRKNEIEDLFRISNRDKIKKNIVFLDDTEEMGESFISDHSTRLKSCNTSFIILYNSNLSNTLSDENTDHLFDFKCSVPYEEGAERIKELSCKKMEMLTVLYILCEVYSLVDLEITWNLMGLEKRFVMRCLKEFHSYGWFHCLLTHKKYIYCTCMIPEKELNVSSAFLNKIILLNEEKIDPLCKWSFIVHSSIDSIKAQQSDKIEKVFGEACDSGNYIFMDQLLRKQSEEKIELFKYQQAVLKFHMGKHDEAFRIYDQLISNSNDPKERNLLMLGIIESCHGSCNVDVINRINAYLTDLEKSGGYFSECAKYWKLHIRTEQGDFKELSREKLKFSFLSIISALSAYKNERVCREIIQRCYTDCIRSFYILGTPCPYEIKKSFLSFLGSNNNKKVYYENLYINANSIHYIEIPKKIFQHEECSDLIMQAVEYYNMALKSGYGDKKSLMAAQLKKCDLKMACSDFNNEEIRDKIHEFKSMASWQKIDVFVAYANTLDMKRLIIKPENLSNDKGLSFSADTKKQIKECYNKAYACYTEFKNYYGTARLDFLLSLFNILTNWRNKKQCQKEFDKINNLVEKYPFLEREKQISAQLPKMELLPEVLTVIKLYPIILQ